MWWINLGKYSCSSQQFSMKPLNVLLSAELTVSKHSAENSTFPSHFETCHLSNQPWPFISSLKKFPLKLAKSPWKQKHPLQSKRTKSNFLPLWGKDKIQVRNTQIQFILMITKCYTYPAAITRERSIFTALAPGLFPKQHQLFPWAVFPSVIPFPPHA